MCARSHWAQKYLRNLFEKYGISSDDYLHVKSAWLTLLSTWTNKSSGIRFSLDRDVLHAQVKPLCLHISLPLCFITKSLNIFRIQHDFISPCKNWVFSGTDGFNFEFWTIGWTQALENASMYHQNQRKVYVCKPNTQKRAWNITKTLILSPCAHLRRRKCCALRMYIGKPRNRLKEPRKRTHEWERAKKNAHDMSR